MQAHNVRGKVDFGIITIREDEFDAVLKRIPPEDHAQGQRHYSISRVQTVKSNYYTVAVVRCPEQGEGEAQDVARDMIP